MMISKKTKHKCHDYGYRSGLELTTGENLKDRNIEYKYESFKIEYIKPETKHKYTPDFILDNYLIIETKGLFTALDRKKHELIQKQFPELEIRFIFSNSNNKIRKDSKTSYADWCKKKGFKYADKIIPQEWILELEHKYNKEFIKKLK